MVIIINVQIWKKENLELHLTVKHNKLEPENNFSEQVTVLSEECLNARFRYVWARQRQ